MRPWNWSSKGFSKRVWVNLEKPRPSRRRITQAPGTKRREWKTSRARIRSSNSSGRIVGWLLAPVQDLELPRAEQADVIETVEPLGERGNAQALVRGKEGDVGDTRLAVAQPVAR